MVLVVVAVTWGVAASVPVRAEVASAVAASVPDTTAVAAGVLVPTRAVASGVPAVGALVGTGRVPVGLPQSTLEGSMQSVLITWPALSASVPISTNSNRPV